MTDEMVVRGQLSQALTGALHRSSQGLKAVPELLYAAIEQRAWEKRVIVETGEVFDGFPCFDAWVCAAPPKGLGASTTIIDGFAKDNGDLAKAVRNARKHQGERTDLSDNFHYNIMEVRQGTSKAYLDERLERERPDSYERVQAGEKSTYAAAVEAGWIKRPFRISNPNDVRSIAQTLRKHLTADQIEELVTRLTGDQP